MSGRDPNADSVELVAHALGELCEELVLVGGCAVGLLVTDPARPSVRATIDVDLVAEVVSLASYYDLRKRLIDRGFQEHGDVICRWRKGALIVDVMPAEEIGLGFSNRWYPLAVQHAQSFKLQSGTTIRVVTAPLFIATKLESFAGRGKGDYAHHDIEDIVNVVDGRKELVDEVADADATVRDYIREEFEDLLADELFTERLPWHLHPDDSNQARVPLLIERLRKLAGL
ncbi:MAG: hypothetical protein JWR21_2498 [Herminiimonas sp.]|nr:hypothetical protein [Herminiimonas sp.]MDB5852276.1 hypothetical protein [Herminiimonas sp.]